MRYCAEPFTMSSNANSQSALMLAYLANQQIASDAHWTDVNNGPRLLHTLWTMLAISTIIVVLRIYVKSREANRLYWDDFFMVLALLFGYGHAISISESVHFGLGRHLVFIPEDQREDCLRIGFISIAFGHLAPMLGRVSFCVTLLYLTNTDPRMRKWPTWITIALQLVVNVVTIIVLYSQCGNQLDILWVQRKQALFLTQCWDPRIQTKYGYFQGCM
jgi:hypothetical protein